MQVNKAGWGRSVTATARRAQIIEATIEVLAEMGYAQTSFARIAEQAGLSSTRLISYHFAGKGELLEQVVAVVTDAAAEYMGPRIEAAAPGRERLRAYIESNLEWMAESRTQIVALLAIFNAVPYSAGGQPAAYAGHYQIVIARLEDYLRQGQRTAELRAFPPRMAAVTIRAAIDAAGYRLGGDPDFDVAGYGRELADFFDQAVRGHTHRTLRREHEQRIGGPAGRGPGGRRSRSGPRRRWGVGDPRAEQALR